MTGIIFNMTEEELQNRLDKAFQKALKHQTPTVPETEYLTRSDVASKLHISLPTLREYSKTGKLKSYKINGRVLYKTDEIEAALTAVEPLKYRNSL